MRQRTKRSGPFSQSYYFLLSLCLKAPLPFADLCSSYCRMHIYLLLYPLRAGSPQEPFSTSWSFVCFRPWHTMSLALLVRNWLDRRVIWVQETQRAKVFSTFIWYLKSWINIWQKQCLTKCCHSCIWVFCQRNLLCITCTLDTDWPLTERLLGGLVLIVVAC